MESKIPEYKQPWSRAYYKARSRCNNPNIQYFHRYGGRGIKCLMSKGDFKTIWMRDNASKMKDPSIDRIDNDGHYTIENCRYVEREENSRKGGKKDTRFCINGHELTEENVIWYGKNKTMRRCVPCHKNFNRIKCAKSKEFFRKRRESRLADFGAVKETMKKGAGNG